MNDELRREVTRWMRYAEEDLQEAERLVVLPAVVPRHPAWLAQQAAEKGLKAVLVAEQIAFPRTHDLRALYNLIPRTWAVRAVEADLERLTEFAVEARYPADMPEITLEEAAAAVQDAASLVASTNADLRERMSRSEQG